MDLAQAARDQVLQRHSARSALPTGWQDDLTAALADTGLLVVAGDQFRFLHQSFAEYLAAWEYAREIPADGKGLEAWIRRASEGTDQTLSRFVLCRWASRVDCSTDLLIDRILTHPYPERSLLAASLIVEGIEVNEERCTRVVRLVVGVFRNDSEEYQTAVDALSALGTRYDTAGILKDLATAMELTSTQRFHALIGLNRLVDPAITSQLLMPILELMYGLLPKAAQLAQQLNEYARQAVRLRVDDLLAEPDAGAWESTIAAETYRALGADEDLRRAARGTLDDPLADKDDLRRAVVAWLDSSLLPEVTAEIVRLGRDRPSFDHAGRLALALALEQAGALTAASELALEVVEAEPFTTSHGEAMNVLLRIKGAAVSESAQRLLARAQESGCESWRQALLLQAMTEAGVHYPVHEWVKSQLSGDGESPTNSEIIIGLWVAAHEGATLNEFRALIGDGTRLNLNARVRYAEILLNAGHVGEAARVATLALQSSIMKDRQYSLAAKVLLKVDSKRAVEVMTSQLNGTVFTSGWARGVLESIIREASPELDELSVRIAERLLEFPDANSSDVAGAIYTLLALGDQGELVHLAERVCRHQSLDLDDQRGLARAFASCGYEEIAREIWRFLLSVRGSSNGTNFILLEDVSQSLSPKITEHLVRELMVADPPPPPYHRQRLHTMLAWLNSSPVRA